jgi:hypothetical protein
MESADIDRVVEEVRAAAERSGALIIDAVLSVAGDVVPAAAVPGAEFALLIDHIKPKIVYLSVTAFEAAEELEASIDDEDLLDNPQAKRLITSWRFRDGQTCRAVLGVMCDGILHGIVEETSWLQEFETQIELMLDELQQLGEENERQLQTDAEKMNAIKVKQLMSDPRFNAPKVGIVKRTALAETLFPGVDRDTIRAIVERAEREHWLATATK